MLRATPSMSVLRKRCRRPSTKGRARLSRPLRCTLAMGHRAFDRLAAKEIPAVKHSPRIAPGGLTMAKKRGTRTFESPSHIRTSIH